MILKKSVISDSFRHKMQKTEFLIEKYFSWNLIY